MKTKGKEHVLGFTVTSRAVHAVLLEYGPDGPEVLRRFNRHRSLHGPGAPGGTTAAVPELQDHDFSGSGGGSTDFSIQFGDGLQSERSLFMQSEFTDFDGGQAGGEGGDGGAHAPTFELELTDVLSECRDAGYEDPLVAFCSPAGDFSLVEVRVPEEARQGKKADRKTLLELLEQQHRGGFDPDRVVFLPMTSIEEGVARHFAVVPKVGDPIVSTLQILRDEQVHRMPQVRLVESEVTLLLSLARRAIQQETTPGPAGPPSGDGMIPLPAPPPPGEKQSTLVVRAGTEDTLVLFLEGQALRHVESLRSLTAFDAPETLCSRVLLQQDEHGVGDVHHVLLLSEEREDDLVETFGMFFPEAQVASVRSHLPRPAEAVKSDGTAVFPAIAVGLRLLDEDAFEGEPLNLLPKQLTRRSIRIPIRWPVVAFGVVLLLTSAFFFNRYQGLSSEIQEVQHSLKQYPPELAETDARVLQSRIDSLNQIHATFTQALNVLDTLLVGSDMWSRTLESVSRESAIVQGVWVDSWRPAKDVLTLEGNATARDRVVELAERVGGYIEQLSFSEIREWPVYSFTLKIPLKRDLPEATKFLRAQVEVNGRAGGGTAGSPSAGSASNK